MTTTYRSKTGAAPRADDEEKIGLPMPCTFCGRITPHLTLRTLGARCEPCFSDYCRWPQSTQDVGDRRQDVRAWAVALRKREESGERLTPLKAAWREALRHEERAE